ncbi:hypothetical protein AB6A40_008484 [Gnathostoma spinigerum]|uniref:Uncharacterized protein n=1 Tax=Gnathostoma spinigerum TaxID=75299 RepID=A0ABD6EQG7_9BILA
MQETLESPFIEGPSSRELEDIINYYLEFYAVEDAVLLAELYYDRAQSEDSLYLLAQCLMRGGQIEATHRLLFVHSNKSPRLRFMYARCCYDLNKLQDAEIALRMDDEPRLHESFEGSPAEPFARSLLARIFLETGRNDSAETEIMKSVESNALSWMGVKSQAEMCQRSDVESGYKKLIVSAKDIRKRMERKDSSIDNVSNNESDDVRTPDVNETSHKVPFAPKKSRSTVLGRKTHEIGVARRRLMEGGGVETRRSARLFGSFQDNENHSVIHLHRDSRHPTHARQLSVTSGISQRTGSDKQLRSMNRINEMEVERCMLNSAPISSPASPSIHKYIEKPNPILESRSKLKSIQPRRTRTTSQSVPTPLASHDQNTPLKVLLHFISIFFGFCVTVTNYDKHL